MAMEEWMVEELEEYAKIVLVNGRDIEEQCVEMRRLGMTTIMLQARANVTVYIKTMGNLAAKFKAEVRDQYKCSLTGEIPGWRVNMHRAAKYNEVKAEKMRRNEAKTKTARETVEKDLVEGLQRNPTLPKPSKSPLKLGVKKPPKTLLDVVEERKQKEQEQADPQPKEIILPFAEIQPKQIDDSPLPVDAFEWLG